MEAQELFNIVANHLLTQKEKSGIYDEGGEFQCLYRGPRGLKCAVGILLKDEEVIEHHTVESLIVDLHITRLIPYKKLIQDLQLVHDSYIIKDWKNCLNSVAEKWGLVGIT